ncbi:MAG: hypothetical protein ACI4WX_08305 [Aristaeellaceae bacterium]
MTSLTPKLFISGFFGLLYAGISYIFLMDLPDAGRYAAMMGLGSFGLVLLVQLLRDERRARRFERAERSLPCPPSFRVGASMREGRQASGVNVYLCRSEVILVNVERREPVLIRLTRESLRRAVLDAPVQLTLELTDGRVLMLLCPYMEMLISELRKIGWFVTEKAR